MPAHWRIPPQVTLHLRCWDDGCALLAEPLGNTHWVPPDLGRALACLLRAPQDAETLYREAGATVSPTDFGARLNELHQAGLIEPA